MMIAAAEHPLVGPATGNRGEAHHGLVEVGGPGKVCHIEGDVTQAIIAYVGGSHGGVLFFCARPRE
jgi:hypothetical protein